MEDWLERLAGADDSAERSRIVAGYPEGLPPDAPAALHQRVLAVLYKDRDRALRLSGIAREVAEARGDDLSRAWSARIEGHCHHAGGSYDKAATQYEHAAKLFEMAGAEAELGRTLLGALQSLIYRGDYDRAHEWAARAEQIFHRQRDPLRLARLDSNVGNIYFRQDRPREALERYRRALEGFEAVGDPNDIAAALSNLAVSSTTVGRFADALSYYQRARAHCQKHGLHNLVARADYNIAYLYYLRGDYAEARRLYEASRVLSEQSGDAYHTALCDLDEAEMYLDLNLTREGERIAHRAVEGFARLGMSYERAKALVSLAVAASQRSDYFTANRTLLQARRLFVKEGNPLWPALVDQLRAAVAFHEGRLDRARRLGASAWRVLTRTMVPGRAAHCQILLARLWLRAGRLDRARAISAEALRRVGDDVSPALRFHTNLVQGEIHETEGRGHEAMEVYEAARREIEELRTRVDSEDLRISVLKDKLAVYEGLVALYLDTPGGAAKSMLLVQQAKSRSLADQLAAPQEPAVHDDPMSALRRDLNLVYRQIDLAVVAPGTPAPARIARLRDRARELESELLEAQSRSGSHQTSSPIAPADDLAVLQQTIRPDELLLEYYEIRGKFCVFLLSRTGIDVARLGPSGPVYQALKLFRFQLRSTPSSRSATDHHLRELYDLLIAPIEHRLTGFRHLVVAAYRDLHGLPFAALHDGTRCLIDRFTVSVTPSAAVLSRIRARPNIASRGSVVIAAPDPRAPRITEEAQLVADTLGDATLVVGEAATIGAFRQGVSAARIMHVAAHGDFRRDSPLFSSFHLADGRLSILDLNGLALNVDLLTLSACSTGMTVAVGADELLGLMRGCLQAGARSMLLTLWDIDDVSANEFMRAFYRGVRSGTSLAEAAQAAIVEVRAEFPHPYYWAPFVLVGEPGPIATAQNS
jgi:tetratricopeptide (TPR) repeat protein